VDDKILQKKIENRQEMTRKSAAFSRGALSCRSADDAGGYGNSRSLGATPPICPSPISTKSAEVDFDRVA